MALIALTNGRIFTGDQIVDEHAVLIDGAHIHAVAPVSDIPTDAVQHDLAGGLLAPGFVDVQVNGGGGVLFNDDPSVATVRRIAAAHRRFGTTGLLPTLISDTADQMTAAIAAVREAMASGVPGILGIHLEGPFLNLARKGAHDPAKLRPMEQADLLLMTSLEAGRTLITLAPEVVPPGAIAALTNAGVVVAAGHTAASYEQIQAALAEGLAGFTHLFNAMTPFGSREPGVVGAALADPGSWCGFIADGFHVHPASLRVAVAAKTRGRLFLVTDAMPPVGAGESDEFQLGGEAVTIRDGRLTLSDGTLAGSCLDMAAAVRNSMQLLSLPAEEALRMASLYPAEFLGLARGIGRIQPGYQADLVLLDPEYHVLGTWIGGQRS